MALLYYIFTVSAWMISRLPFRLIYGLSDGLYLVLCYVLRYRKSTVYTNLHNSFPDKSKQEIQKIVRQFYRNLADIMLEIIKWRSIKPAQLLSRFSFENYDLFKKAFSQNKSIIVTIGHCGNWEWMGAALDLISDEKGFAVVKPLSDKRFNGYVKKLRQRITRGGTIPYKDTFRTLLRNRNEMLTFNVFAADQTPAGGEINYRTPFLNQDTPFFSGIEKITKALDFTVLFIDIQRRERGKYTGVISLITDDPKSMKENEIMEKYVKALENAILNQPDNWLWSHRRWKHLRDES